MAEAEKPIANPLVVLREEFNDWAILFDPDTGNAFDLNPVGVLIWKCLDGRRTVQDVMKELQEKCEGVPKDAEEHVIDFIKNLVEEGLVGYET